VTVTATEDTIEVDNITYSPGDQDENVTLVLDNSTEETHSESEPENTTGDTIEFYVNVTVYSDEDLNNIGNASINIYASNQDIGDALGESENTSHFYHQWENTDWDGESESLDIRMETDADDTFLRYGDWNIEANITDDDGTQLDEETFNEQFDVEEYTVFEGPADLSATIDPGQSVGINTAADVNFTVGSGGTDTANVSVITNYDWGLEMSNSTLEALDTTDEIPAETDNYSQELGSPTTEIEIAVELLYTATDVRPGTYTTSLTHTLSNSDNT